MSYKSKTIQQLKKHKKALQRPMMTNYSSDIRKKFWEACRAISDLKKTQEEKAWHENHSIPGGSVQQKCWEFSKLVTREEFEKEKKSPTFSKA